MKKLLALLLAFMLCFAFAACGDEEPVAEEPVVEEVVAEETAVTSIVGEWECVDAKMVDNGEEFGADQLTAMFGVEVKEMLSLSAYDDGNGEMNYLGDVVAFAWTESEGGYAIAPAMPEGEPQGELTVISAKLENEQLIVTFSDTYDMDGTEVTTEMIYTMEYLD